MDVNKIKKGINDALKDMQEEHKKVVQSVILASLLAVDPFQAIISNIKLSNDVLTINKQNYFLKNYKNIYIIGVGKASIPMAKAVEEKLGDTITKGVVISKAFHEEYKLCDSIDILIGGHPVPNQSSLNGTQKIIQLLQNSEKDDLVLFLISGGASALMTSPVGNIKLNDIQDMTKSLLACGANINEINTIRKHIDLVKGGGLARLAFPSTTISLILSDVIGNPLDVIASGPTVSDSTTFSDTFEIIKRYKLENKLPNNILDVLEKGYKGKIQETVKPGDECLEDVKNIVIASNLTSALKAQKEAKILGLNSYILTTYLSGEANQAGIFLSSLIKEIVFNDQPIKKPACIISGGETTVTLKGEGKGGRNTELALGSVQELSGIENIALITLATDGEDGPTNAAGAVVTGKTLQDGISINKYPKVFLDNNDSYHYFESLGNLLKIGSTGTNVNDLSFLFVF